jgi:predicted PurR-regulated permease PerM
MSLARFALWLFILTLVGWLMIVGRNLLLPLVLALVFWYLIDALANFYTRFHLRSWRLPRSLALTGAILTSGGLLWLLGNIIGSNVSQVVKAAPGYQARLQAIINSVTDYFGVSQLNLTELFDRFDIGGSLSQLAGGVASVAGVTGIIIVYVGFLFVEQVWFNQKLALIMRDPERGERLRGILHQITLDIQTYIRIKTSLAVITAGIGYIIMRIVGLDFAGFWAVLIFFFYYIPTVGSLLAIISPTVLTLVQFESIWQFIVVASAFGFTQIMMANFIEPMIMGRSLNLSPFVIILSLVVWGTIWGVIGMFLCMPIMVILMIVLANFEQTRPIAVMLSADGRIISADESSTWSSVCELPSNTYE